MNAPLIIVHSTLCLCEVCAPISLPTRSPSMQSAVVAERDLDAQQLLTQFEQLDPYGRRVAKAMMAALVKIKRVT